MSNSKITKHRDKKGNSYSHLYIDQNTGIFYVRIRVGDSVRSSSLETTDFNKARALVIDRAAQLSNADYTKPGNKIIADFYAQMIAEKTAAQIKPQTISRIETIWRLSLKPFWEYCKPEDINQDKVTDFITWHRRNRPGRQLFNVLKYLSNILDVMIENEGLPPNKKPRLDLPKDEERHQRKQKGRYVTDAEAKALVENSEGFIKLMILIAYCAGMRKMEIGSLELSRLKRSKDRYIVKLDTDDTKTGLAREIPLPAFLTPLIEAQIIPGATHLFPMKSDPKRFMSSQLIDKDWVEVKKAAEITGRMRFHDLRHTAASNFSKSNINPFVAVTILGMSFQTYQKRYLKLVSEDLIIGTETNADRLGESLK